MSFLHSLFENEELFLLERRDFNPMYQKFATALQRDVHNITQRKPDDIKTDRGEVWGYWEWKNITQHTSSTFTSPVPGRNVTTHRTERTTWFLKRARIPFAIIAMKYIGNILMHDDQMGFGISEFAEKFKNSIKVIREWINALEGETSDEMLSLSAHFSVNMKESNPALWEATKYGTEHTLFNFRHYQTIQYHRITEYDFTGKSTRTVLNDLKQLEEEYKTLQKEDDRYIYEDEMEDDVKVLIDFNDGFAWYDLQTSVSDDEARTMRHCCTDPRTQYEGTVYSLREKAKRKGKWAYKPHATFMVKGKTLYEMKGFGNDKPNEKLHKYIVPLLESKYVEQVVGGGYMQHKNFSVLDLPENIRKPLIKKKPGILSFSEALKVFGPKSEEFKSKVHTAATKNYGFKYDKEYDGYIIHTYKNLKEYIDEHIHEDSKYIANMFTGDYDHYEHYFHNYSMKELPYSAGEIAGWCDDDNKDYIIRYAFNNYAEDLEDLNIDRENARDSITEIIKLLMVEDDQFQDHLVYSMNEGDRVGAESEMYEAFKDNAFGKEVLPYNDESDVSFDVATLVDGKVWQAQFNWDVPVAIIANHSTMATYINDHSEEIEDEQSVRGEIKIEQPHYGWSGHDSSVTEEDFSTMLRDRLSE